MSLTWGKERSGIERRSGFDRRALSPQAAEMLRCCQLVGALFVGIQQGFPPVPDQLLFQSHKRGTTLCLAIHEVTPLRIMERISEVRGVRAVPLVIPIQRSLDLFGQNLGPITLKGGTTIEIHR